MEIIGNIIELIIVAIFMIIFNKLTDRFIKDLKNIGKENKNDKK